jgi:hypothetical protein
VAQSLFLIFNHTFTHPQEQDAEHSLGVDKIIPLPLELQSLWSNIPPELEGLRAFLEPIKIWLSKSSAPGDYVLIQGDFGACFLMVRYCLEQNLIPIYSTTARRATETVAPDGSIRLTHEFMHIRFRRYGE